MLFIAITIVHVASCVLLIIAVLLQSGKDAGLSGAFGMSGGGQTIFGARAGDVLTKATLVLAVIFLGTCLAFTRVRPSGGGSIVRGLPGAGKAARPAAVPAGPMQPAAPPAK